LSWSAACSISINGYLYDLTSILRGPVRPQCQAKLGHSRDHDPTANSWWWGAPWSIVLALRSPMRFFAGNTHMSHHVGHHADRLGERVGLTEGSTVVIDRGHGVV